MRLRYFKNSALLPESLSTGAFACLSLINEALMLVKEMLMSLFSRCFLLTFVQEKFL